jgi:hypothetical protein
MRSFDCCAEASLPDRLASIRDVIDVIFFCGLYACVVRGLCEWIRFFPFFFFFFFFLIDLLSVSTQACMDPIIVAVVAGLLLLVVWFFFFRGEADTRSSFNPTPGGTTAFKSISVPTGAAAKKALAPKISKEQRAKDEVSEEVILFYSKIQHLFRKNLTCLFCSGLKPELQKTLENSLFLKWRPLE